MLQAFPGILVASRRLDKFVTFNCWADVVVLLTTIVFILRY